MKNKIIRIIFIAVPLVCVSIFLYMTFFNSSYDHPGAYVYQANCASCHGDKGEGIQELVPPLYSSDMALQHFDSLPCWIIMGIDRPITVNGRHYDQPMYPIAITPIEMTNLMNYLATDMIHTGRTYKSDSVTIAMRKCGQKGI